MRRDDTRALIGWENEDYNRVNKKLIDYGHKFNDHGGRYSRTDVDSKGKKDSRTYSKGGSSYKGGKRGMSCLV